MNESKSRALVSDLADDLSWLEQHCRQKSDNALEAGRLRLAAALVRNAIGPFLDGQEPIPLHATVVGGASAGKSTVVNLLTGASGAAAAEANAQAGFTRHPVCYTNANGAITWPAHLGFLGPLVRLDGSAPSSLDKDVYQVRRVPPDSLSETLLQNFVVWDCPDMTTWAAGSYIPRLLEVCGLTDVLVYVASDERYNDRVPTEFLQLLLQAGKPVICCLTKMREADAKAFLDHFKSEILEKMQGGGPAINTLAIPYLSVEDLANPTGKAAKYRIELLNQVRVLGEPPARGRAFTVRLAMNYLVSHTDDLLGVARDDLNALESWRSAVEAGKCEFESRYRQEYLNSEKFRRFDEALIRLLELLELPGLGKLFSNAMRWAQAPFRLVKSWISKGLQRPEAPPQPERPVLETALAGWLDFLRKEALQRSDTHPLWAHIEQGFTSESLPAQVKDHFEQNFRNFQLGLADEVERTARSIYEELEKKPVLLNTLRGGKAAMDIGSIVAAVLTAGHTVALNVVLIPVAATVSGYLVELLGQQYVENQRETTRTRQEALMHQHISGPLAQWLTEWPATGGSAYERLHQALKRIPPNLLAMSELVNRQLAKMGF
jgi:hypothetical protein